MAALNENIVEAERLSRDEITDYERADPLTIRANSVPLVGTESQLPVRQTILIPRAGADGKICANKLDFGLARIVEREGLAKDECEKFELGAEKTLYVPLYFKVVPETDRGLREQPELYAQDSRPVPEILLKSTNKAVASAQFDVTKVEMGILMHQAADVAFGISNADRIRLHAHIETHIIGSATWRPDGIGNESTKVLSLALLAKADEIRKIQADQGKVWRSRDTVAHIRKSAMTVAASYNNVLLRNNFFARVNNDNV